jgi:hypothetical protein
VGYRVLTAVGGQEVLDREGNRINPLVHGPRHAGPSNGLMLAEEMRRRALEVLVLLTTGYNEDWRKASGRRESTCWASPTRAPSSPTGCGGP